MLNKSNLKEKVTFMLGYTVVMALIMLALMGCTPPEDNNGGDDPGTGPPPPHSGCDYPETEFNDTWLTPNFVTSLPIIGEGIICGELTLLDIDTFYFALQPPHPTHAIRTNFYIETDPDLITNARLVRILYNKHGQPTGDYDIIWNAFSHEGEILMLDVDIEYDETLLPDLLLDIRQVPFSAVPGNFEYEITFWNN